MSEAFEAFKIADDVYWVGAIDWDVRNFHGYQTSRGTTYNAFLILAEKPVLIDTVRSPFFDEMMARVASVIEPGRVEYIVSNHAEPDHSGGLVQAIQAIRPGKVLASKMGRKALVAHYHMPADRITVVGDDDTLDLGNMTVHFAETRMCHWPDSMVSYLADREVLFSQDAFGMHIASAERFADELSADLLDAEARKYYANILLHLSRFVDKTLAKLGGLGLPLKILAPDHGPIYRRPEDIENILASYARWSAQKPANKAVLIYDTMWHSTAKMADAIAEGLTAAGTKVELMSLATSHRTDVATQLLDAGAVVVGSPTLNNGILPSVADVMTYIKGLSPRNLVGAAFGSYGWSGEAPKILHAMLREMDIKTVADPLRINYVPDAAALRECREFGKALGVAIGDFCNDAR